MILKMFHGKIFLFITLHHIVFISFPPFSRYTFQFLIEKTHTYTRCCSTECSSYHFISYLLASPWNFLLPVMRNRFRYFILQKLLSEKELTTSDLIMLDFISISAQKAMCNFCFYLQPLESIWQFKIFS